MTIYLFNSSQKIECINEGYIVEVKSSSDNWQLLKTFSLVESFYIDENIKQVGNSYAYRIRKIFPWGESTSWVETPSTEFLSWKWKDRKMFSPLNITVDTIGAKKNFSIKIDIKDYGDIIERKIGSGQWEPIGVVYQNSFIDNDINSAEKHYYRVTRKRFIGNNEVSAEIQVVPKVSTVHSFPFKFSASIKDREPKSVSFGFQSSYKIGIFKDSMGPIKMDAGIFYKQLKSTVVKTGLQQSSNPQLKIDLGLKSLYVCHSAIHAGIKNELITQVVALIYQVSEYKFLSKTKLGITKEISMPIKNCIGLAKTKEIPFFAKINYRSFISTSGNSTSAFVLNILGNNRVSFSGESNSSLKAYLNNRVLLIDGSESSFLGTSFLNNKVFKVMGESLFFASSVLSQSYNLSLSGSSSSFVNCSPLLTSLICQRYNSKLDASVLFKETLFLQGANSSSYSCTSSSRNLTSIVFNSYLTGSLVVSQDILVALDTASLFHFKPLLHRVMCAKGSSDSIGLMFVPSQMAILSMCDVCSDFETHIYKTNVTKLECSNQCSHLVSMLASLVNNATGEEVSDGHLKPLCNQLLRACGDSICAGFVIGVNKDSLLITGLSSFSKDLLFTCSMSLSNNSLSLGRSSLVNISMIVKSLTQSYAKVIKSCIKPKARIIVPYKSKEVSVSKKSLVLKKEKRILSMKQK